MSGGTYQGDLRARLAANWWLKFLSITVFITVFFYGYFLLLRFPLFGVTVMPLTAIDRMITFQPWSLGLYFSLWFYVSLPPALLRTRPELRAYGLLAVALALAAFSIFIFWPTSIPPATDIEWANHPGFAMLRRVDLDQISERYFFETSMLIELNILRARVADVEIPDRKSVV